MKTLLTMIVLYLLGLGLLEFGYYIDLVTEPGPFVVAYITGIFLWVLLDIRSALRR